jgi:hypothetical protein
VHELVIVVSDLYVSQETPERGLPGGVALPGLQHAARFGTRSRIPRGWRPWLAWWLTGHESGAPATVAAQVAPSEASMVWMATPVHLVAGLTSLHLDRRSILRLGAEDSAALAAEFRGVFHDSGFLLQPLDSGDFLLSGPQLPPSETPEPARSLGDSLAHSQRAGSADPALRRLGAEIEMWLHDHPVNDSRSRRGELPVTGLWLWGGGPMPEMRRPHDSAATGSSDIAFGRDAYLQGLWAALGEKVFPLPEQLTDVFSYSQARRAALVIEIGPMLHSNPTWTFFDAVAQIDRSFITPAVDALNQGRFERLAILANDHQLTARARDRLKLWRRIRPGLSGLQ